MYHQRRQRIGEMASSAYREKQKKKKWLSGGVIGVASISNHQWQYESISSKKRRRQSASKYVK
jgi:hypothetical protein